MAVWDTSTPAGSDPANQGDDRIREFKVAVQDALRAGEADGDEALFPGPNPTTDPIFRHRGGYGATAGRPAAAVGGQYYNTDTGTLQRSNGSSWVELTENAAYEAIHHKVAQSLASVGGVVTLPETANAFAVSGTETITSIAGWSAGIVRIQWSSARIITHSASLYLGGALSRNVVAGDISTFMFNGSNSVVEVDFFGALSGKEAGEVFEWAGASVPAGSLECDGSSLLRSDYPRLYANIGTVHGTADATHFNLPDHRGRFARGYDHGAGKDPDAASRTAAKTGGASGDNVGSVQDDAFKSHTHTQNGALNSVNADGASGGFANTFGGNTGATGGNETRPKNVYVMKCIRY